MTNTEDINCNHILTWSALHDCYWCSACNRWVYYDYKLLTYLHYSNGKWIVENKEQ